MIMPSWSNADLHAFMTRRGRKQSQNTEPEPAAPAVFAPQPTTDEAKLNRTEKAYLEHLRADGARELQVQSITFKLGDDCRFTPDFTYIDAAGKFVAVDVKGFQREDALVKIKTAARRFTWVQFVVVKKDKDSWQIIAVKP